MSASPCVPVEGNLLVLAPVAYTLRTGPSPRMSTSPCVPVEGNLLVLAPAAGVRALRTDELFPTDLLYGGVA